MYGKDPDSPIDLTDKAVKVPAAEEFIKRMSNSVKEARDHIIKAQAAQKKQADKHRREHTFKIGDQVMVSNRNMNPADRRSRKLGHRWEGPFIIIAKFGDNSFKLDLPNKMNIHATFHSSLLKPYVKNDQDLFPGRIQVPPPPITIDSQPEYEVETIIGKRKHRNQTQYLVKWVGYDDLHNSWEPASHLKNAKQKIKDFLDQQTLGISIMVMTQSEDPQAQGFKKGERFDEIPHQISNHQQQPTATMRPQHQYRQVPYTTIERLEGETIYNQAQDVRTYTIRKYILVTDTEGELLYAFKSWDNDVYFYRPARMVFLSLHTKACDCKMCDQVNAPEEHIRRVNAPPQAWSTNTLKQKATQGYPQPPTSTLFTSNPLNSQHQ